MIILTAISWFLVIAFAGWLAFPLAYRFFSFLPDRGLALARPLGLLLWGYVYWMLVSLHILQNDAGGALFSLLVVASLSGMVLLKSGWVAIRRWLSENWKSVISTELVFLAAFIVLLVLRAANPDAMGTEKPMELAFINAILRSPTFPPNDPWLSGYAISYYYFGYVMVAILAKMTGVSGAVAFNLAVASWFGLSALSAYGLLVNLLELQGLPGQKRNNRLSGLCAPFFVLVASNLDGILEVLHARGVFWKQLGDGKWVSGFWKWLDIQELTSPPALPFSWQPERTSGIWWWRASRVLQDYALDGSTREIIDEFPMFSFLLGDLHPHVLAMPFALLSIGLALNVYLWVRSAPSGKLYLASWVKRPDFWLAALILGSLSFLNTWDFPMYLALFAGGIALASLISTGWTLEIVINFFVHLFVFGFAGGVLYLPFYVSFSSQASGLLPSLVFVTRGAHFWVMFGIALSPIIMWLLLNLRECGSWKGILKGIMVSTALVAGLLLLSLIYGFVRLQVEPGLAGIWAAQDTSTLLIDTIRKRLASPGAWITQTGLLILAWALLITFLPGKKTSEIDTPVEDKEIIRLEFVTGPFILLLVFLGAGLVVFPEYFYLRDQFGYRMNTIFKFYFQSWILWGIAAAYASVFLLRRMPVLARYIGLVLLGVVALPYAYYGLMSRTNGLEPVVWSLDGADSIARYSPLEMEAINWLQNAPYGIVVEAVGGSYTGYARISTHSGLPTVLGWPGHESQWRGGGKEMGTRQVDIEQLYRADTWEQASLILSRYQIRYLYIGATESRDYRPDVNLFRRHMAVVFQNQDVIIFESPTNLVDQE